MGALFRHFIKLLIDWLFRRRSPALFIMRAGLICEILAFGSGWTFGISVPFQNDQLTLSFDSAGGAPMFLTFGAGVIGLALLVIGFVWEICRYRDERKSLDRKKVLVIEARGLRDASGTPLIEAIPENLKGHRDHILVDMRQHIKDGEIVAPEAALAKLISLPIDIRRRENGFDRRDLTLVYGGLAPVPLTFLTGILIDDESTVSILDWDRHKEAWRELNESDDGKRFGTPKYDKIPVGTLEVALSMSVSYGVNEKDVRTKVGKMPLIVLNLEDGSPNCHWSEEKQRSLGKQFLKTIVGLGNRHVKRIHLFLAAQNSVTFRFGRLYDKRNLPEIVVYQYQRGSTPPYPWGILMPVSGIDQPSVIDV